MPHAFRKRSLPQFELPTTKKTKQQISLTFMSYFGRPTILQDFDQLESFCLQLIEETLKGENDHV